MGMCNLCYAKLLLNEFKYCVVFSDVDVMKYLSSESSCSYESSWTNAGKCCE